MNKWCLITATSIFILFSEMKGIHTEEKETPEERRSLQLFLIEVGEHFRANRADSEERLLFSVSIC